jgi:hypothetical protein
MNGCKELPPPKKEKLFTYPFAYPRPHTRDSKCSAYAKTVERVKWPVVVTDKYLAYLH